MPVLRLKLALALPYSGYNIFAVGTAGLGKRTMIKRLLQQHAKNIANAFRLGLCQ